MFWFAMISVIGLVALIVSIICLVTDINPFGLWITIFGRSLALVVIGSIGGAFCRYAEEKNATIQEEYIDQYNYCPYCGKEIK